MSAAQTKVYFNFDEIRKEGAKFFAGRESFDFIKCLACNNYAQKATECPACHKLICIDCRDPRSDGPDFKNGKC